jgi:hypothetical protein
MNLARLRLVMSSVARLLEFVSWANIHSFHHSSQDSMILRQMIHAPRSEGNFNAYREAI